MLTTAALSSSPRILDHPQAQRFIRDWLARWKREHAAEAADFRVEFREKVSRCTIKIDWGTFGQLNNHVVAQYDLARPETEALLHNTLTALVEPKDAWKVRETRWKGTV